MLTNVGRSRGSRGFRYLVPALMCAGSILFMLPSAALEPGEFDPSALDGLLGEFVRDGRVDYGAWKKGGVEALDAFLAEASDYDLTSVMGKEPRAAFLINVYNAWAIRQVLEHYPVQSVQDIPGFFDENELPVAGTEESLNTLEARLAKLLPHLPGFVLLLNPGAEGAPGLGSEALQGETFYARLKTTSRAYIRGRAYYVKEAEEFHIPEPIDRYREELDALPGGLPRFFSDYLDLSDVVVLSTGKPKIVVDPMNWTLNDTAAADSTKGGEGSR